MREYIATSERAYRRSDEVENKFSLKDENLQVGDTFDFEGIKWTVEEVGVLIDKGVIYNG